MIGAAFMRDSHADDGLANVLGNQLGAGKICLR
jgi:hypothetical protein